MRTRWNTRFNPTLNGPLHLGHVYALMVNQAAAFDTGGKFVIRFEDDAPHMYLTMTQQEIEQAFQLQCEAIEWLEIEHDGYFRQSEMLYEMLEFARSRNLSIPEYRWPYSMALDVTLGQYDPQYGEWYPYAPYLTSRKVIFDYLNGTNVLIRGVELLPEFAYYQHWADMAGIDRITHYYLPRLIGPDGETVSKRAYSPGVLEYKAAGWEPWKVIRHLEQAVLINVGLGWRLDNIKREPRLGKATYIEK